MNHLLNAEQSVVIPIGDICLNGILVVPEGASGIILFAHGSGSSRFSARNQQVAGVLNEAGFATLLFDLLTPYEEQLDAETGALRFDIGFLARRLVDVTDWCLKQKSIQLLPLGYFGASTGGGAAIAAAANKAGVIRAVVLRGGRPDLAGDALRGIHAPTLLIVGGDDLPVVEMNREAMRKMHCTKKLEIIPGATHLFEEPGKLDEVARLAQSWFSQWVVSG